MKTKIFTFLIFCCVLKTHAQVTIVDVNFKNVLKNQFPTCFSGELLDTLCAAKQTYLSIDGGNYSTIDELRYFKSLRNFSCSSTNLTSFPPLPKTLRYFTCHAAKMSTLPTLPDSLLALNCWSGQLTTLLPFPKTLQYFNLQYNKLTSLPALPPSVRGFNCIGNKLTELPALPSTMDSIICSGNLLTSLPSLNIKLRILQCSHNLLTSLPELPTNLEDLDCSNNNLSSLPALPQTLKYLRCYNDRLYCLPLLPEELYSLGYENYSGGYPLKSKITCIPNRPTSLYQTRLPLCSPVNNLYQCQTNPVVSGRVFIDENKNNIKDANESNASHVKVRFIKTNYYTFSNDTGYYELSYSLIKGKAEIGVESPIYYLSKDTSIEFRNYNDWVKHNFALQPQKSIKDLSVSLINLGLARPGFPLALKLEVKNKGTFAASGIVTFTSSSNFHLDSSHTTGVWAGPNMVEYPTIKPGASFTSYFYGTVSSTIEIGDTLQFLAAINPQDVSDSTLTDNVMPLSLIVRGSFDPNDKQGPSKVTTQQIMEGNFVDYTIRFQNTGTDTAFTVVIADTLHENLLANSIELTSCSHPCRFSLKENKIYFEFLNILLPDSHTIESKSHGYVKFRIKPKSSLVIGNTFTNTSAIYFDYNSPIFTNTVRTKVDDPLLSNLYAYTLLDNSRIVYPNPIENGKMYIHSKENYARLSNSFGKTVLEGSFNNEGWDISNLTKGIYFLEIGVVKEKILIK